MEKTYTTFDVAKMCGVYPTTVVDWIESGKLGAFSTPGGHRRIKEDDLMAFLREYNIPISEEIKDRHPAKILIVDDDPGVVRTLEKLILRKFHGIEFAAAQDGFAAGVKLKDFMPDLILLDIMLPGINGFGVCKAIKTDEKTKNIRIIAMTGFDSEENKNKMFECGADDYIAKPFDNNELARKIDSLLKQSMVVTNVKQTPHR